MADRHGHARPVGRTQALSRPCAHAGGIVGRLTYIPAQINQGTGQLRKDRARGEIPQFQQVTPFNQWSAPTKTAFPDLGSFGPSQLAKSQNNWLLKTLPEAFLGDVDTETLLIDEISNTYSSIHPPPPPTASLLATGEITDVRDPDRVKGHTVLATASGESGHILRLISLAREEWSWTDEDVKIRLHVPNHHLEGDWCQDSVPISLIKFVNYSKKYDQVRWLIVQKPTSTTVCEPELRKLPVQSSFSVEPSSSTLTQLVANPLFAITSDRSGGGSHSDVSFNPLSDDQVPQLAIIDQAGYWSVWDIVGRRGARPKVMKPVLRMCGNINLGSIPRFPRRTADDQESHRIMWLSLKRDRSNDESRPGSRSRSSTRAKLKQRLSRASLLLLGNSTTLCLFDTETGKSEDQPHLLSAKKGQRLLDLGPSHLDPSQAFLLTNTTISWLSVKEYGTRLRLEPLVLSPHRRDVQDQTLRLEVSPGTFIDGALACFVSIRSIRNGEVTVFWFISPSSGKPLRYHRESVRLKASSKAISVAMLPVERRVGQAKLAAPLARALAKSQTRFFQLVTLGHDLDLSCSLCMWSDEPGVRVRSPDECVARSGSAPEKTRLREQLRHAFALPDEFDDRSLVGDSRTPELGQGSSGTLKREPDALSLVVYGQVLADRLVVPSTANEAHPSQNENDITRIAEVISREIHNGYMPRHSLLHLVKQTGGVQDVVRLASHWSSHQHLILEDVPGKLVPTNGRHVLSDDIDRAFEKLTTMFSHLPSNRGKASQGALIPKLQLLAAETLLSEAGVAAVPEEWVAAETWDGRSSQSQPFASYMPFGSSPPLFSSQVHSQFVHSQSQSQSQGYDATQSQEQPDSEDAVGVRLRQYAAMNPVPRRIGGRTRVTSHWELGEDPNVITWKPGQDDEEDDASLRRRRKLEAKRKKREKLLARIRGVEAVKAESQPLPFAIQSSQPRGFAFTQNTQPESSQFFASQPMSQIVAGPHGGRPSHVKKKQKVKKRMGFR
ncbi:RNA polymerase I-specific transcription initiation factor RRN6-like protein [Pseudoneurospora amorphoporcata]|uniref:RNA polymerase I-specific transcription initiation factor RRN6-like protein n=1 Tax=Pseudoneurospora amorphoporcata TaxID=241081 RepID=A0AAN6P2W0_9PEZI|nr:RNA polymerase I-specific transcription initiation factor RRN6-like protein [Pseudoneurospora amorphoporcata]